ncbi:hypothetical protein TNCV_3444941 [Trichonephila clavipes]|nr:hypothetical protein TNCV_3444941 [Trichonephila clavipes]
MMWVSGKRLSGRRLLIVVSLWFLLNWMSGRDSRVALNRASDVVGADLLIARSSRSFVFLGRPDPPRRYTLPSVIHCCQHRATTISALRPRWRPIRLFDQPASLRPLYGPYQMLVLPPVTS